MIRKLFSCKLLRSGFQNPNSLTFFVLAGPHKQISLLRKIHTLNGVFQTQNPEVVDGCNHNHTVLFGVHSKCSDNNSVLPTDVLHKWSFTTHSNQLLALVLVLVNVPDVSGGHWLLQRNRNGLGNTLEPLGNMRHEGNRQAQLRRNFTLVNVVGQRVWNQVVSQHIDVVLWRWLGSCSRVARNTKNRCESSGTNQGDPRLGSVRSISEWWIGFSRSCQTSLELSAENTTLDISMSAEASGLGARLENSALLSCNLLGEVFDQGAHLLNALCSVPEQNVSVLSKRPIGLGKEPSSVWIVFLDCPLQSTVVFSDSCKDVISHVVEPSGFGSKELVELGNSGCIISDNGEHLKRLVAISLELDRFECLQVRSHRGGTGRDFDVSVECSSKKIWLLKFLERVSDQKLVTSSDQSSGTRVGEQFLLQIVHVNDGDRGRARQMHQQVSDFLDLQLGSTIFNGSNTLAISPAATSALTFKIWPEEVSANEVRIGKAPAWIEASTGALLTPVMLPTSCHQLEVLFQETLSDNGHCSLVGDTDTVDVIRLDSLVLEDLIDLRSGTVQNNWIQPHMVQESKTRSKLWQLLGDDGSTDLDDGELLL
ncbi:hypothetical protein OGAPHI_001793 [Ogataea philodendri]|uniref:Uncharacterized protein n=1 Tax=Ogataea philodendri TaxID=1378263 RepID=A0A9P8PB56_9ASCO|nr:uncharacterized protein OGAPHI_001793 [Ogataea philodendri]KAH3668039.1 hypothetical protein OGAPHI_001793 [Ogataea philodendri]